MKLIWSTCFLLFCWSMTEAQPLSELAFQAAKNNDFNYASRLYLQALEQAKSVEHDELTFDIYSKLQECFTSQFKLDSSVWIFEEAERFALNRGNFEKYFDFKLGRAEIIYIQGGSAESALIFNEVAEDKNVPTYHLIRAHLRLAGIYNVQSDSSAAYRHIETALKQARLDNDSSILGGILESYATIERDFGSTFKAIDLYQKAIPFFKHEQNKFRLGSINRKISYIFQTLENREKALEFCHAALTIAKEQNHKGDRALAESLLGELYLENGEYELSKEYFNRALAHYSKKDARDRLSNLHSHLAAVEIKLQLPENALYHLNEARGHITSDIGVNAKFYYYFTKAEYELEFGENILEARRAIDTCKQIVLLSDNEYITQQTLNLQVAYYQKIGNFEQALLKKEEYVNLSNKIRKRNQSQLVHDLEAKYQNEILDKEVDQLSTLNTLHQSRLNQQKIIIYSGGTALLIIGFFGYFFYHLYNRVNTQNEAIDKALEEKELLLKEIHHRVKNNLQVISSLLALQSGYVQDDKAIEALKHGQDRVRSMALIHQDLYQADNLKGVNVHKYFDNLVDNLFDSYQIDDGDVDLKIDVVPITLDVDTMIPLGLVVNELVSNVFKHAFAGRPDGKVELLLREVDSTLILSIKDNGIGLKSIDVLSGDTFGFQMIKAFANKLKAEMEVNHENGLEIKLFIKNYTKIQ